MKKGLFIYNAASGDHSVPNKLDTILGRFQEKNILIQPYRLYCGEHENLVSLLKDETFEFAMISGGDGTINSVVNTILKNEIQLPVGILPTGTCNDFARSLNLPNSLDECLSIILNGNIMKIDVGLINGETYFLGTCAGGFFVDVSFNTDSELKKNFGPLAYYLQAIGEVKNKKSFTIKLKTDTDTIKNEVLLFLILNGKNAGGFSNIVKEADISDGIMEIILIKDCNHIDLANMFFKVLSNDLLRNKNVKLIRTKSCTIESNVDIPLSVDGEKGVSLPIKVEFLNKVLSVFTK